MAGIDSSFKAALFVGYHSKAGTLGSIMSHTYELSIFSLKFNGMELDEIGTDAAIAGYYNVPVVMVTGDRAACIEAIDLLGEMETVAVKEGVSRSSAICIQPSRARELIKETAASAINALTKAPVPKPFAISPPVKTEVVFTDPSYADGVANLPFVERINGRTIAFTADDFIKAFELFNAIQFLAGVIR